MFTTYKYLMVLCLVASVSLCVCLNLWKSWPRNCSLVCRYIFRIYRSWSWRQIIRMWVNRLLASHFYRFLLYQNRRLHLFKLWVSGATVALSVMKYLHCLCIVPLNPFSPTLFLIVAKWVYQSGQCHTGLTHPLIFWHLGSLVLSGQSWAPECPNAKKLKIVG